MSIMLQSFRASLIHGARRVTYRSTCFSGITATEAFATTPRSRWHSTSSSEGDRTIFDTESEMFQLRRRMTSAYSQGNYQDALEFALDMKAKAIEIMGQKNAVYASCLNNVALMVSMTA